MTTTTTFTIDCETCPARGRMCGDCFVPVLGRSWLQGPAVPPPATVSPAGAPTGTPPTGREHEARAEDALPAGMTAPLDTDELAAVSAFVRAGLVDPEEAAQARAVVGGARYAAG